MTSRKFRAALAVCVLAPEVQGGSVTYQLTLNPSACHDVHLGRFTLPKEAVGTQEVKAGYCRPEIRSGGEALRYIAVVCTDLRNWHPATEKYAVDLSRPDRVRRIDETTWTLGQPLAWSAPNAFGRSGGGSLIPDEKDAGVRYFGPLLKRSGPKWKGESYGPLPPTLLSASLNRAAVNSWDGYDLASDFLDQTVLFQRSKVKGNYWVDIYETASGRPLIRITGEFRGASPPTFQQTAAWYSDRYYVMPIGRNLGSYSFGLRNLLVCDVDAASRAQQPVLKERK